MEKYFEEGISPKTNFGTLFDKPHARVNLFPSIAVRHIKQRGSTIARRREPPPTRPQRNPRSPAEDETNTRAVKDDEDLSALAFKIMSDKHMGKLTYIRIYSGSLESGSTIWNATQGRKQRVGRLLRMHSNRQEAIDKAYAGDIVAVVGLGETKTGDTLCTQDNPIALESMDFPEPVISISIKPESNADNEKLGEALHRLADEDPTFTVAYDQETNETIISGVGELHLELSIACVVNLALLPKSVAPVATVKPQRCPRMLLQTRQAVRWPGQYGRAVVSVEPQQPGEGFEFINEITGGRIPQVYSFRERQQALESGPYAGYPVVDMRVRLTDGSYHDVDSSDFAFQIAARQGFKELF